MGIGIVMGLIFILDQATKLYVKHAMDIGQSVPVLGEVLKITYIENPGIAFGLQIGNSLVFTILSLLVSIAIAVYLFTHLNEPRIVRLSLAMILGGAFGNLLDRVLYSRVVDFLDIGLNASLRWPVFNIADSAVVAGMVILFIVLFRQDLKQKAEPSRS